MHCESYVSCLGPFGSILMQFWDLFTLLYWIVAFSRMLLDGASAVKPSRKPFRDDNLVSPGHHRYYALGLCGIFLSLQYYLSGPAYLCTSQISSRPSPHVRWTGSTSEEFTGLHTRCSQPLPSSLRAFFSRLTESLIWLVKVPPSLMQENHHLTASFLHEIDESSRDISKPSSISPVTMSTATCLSHPSPSRLIKKSRGHIGNAA
jgi:hypothetical protein